MGGDGARLIRARTLRNITGERVHFPRVPHVSNKPNNERQPNETKRRAKTNTIYNTVTTKTKTCETQNTKPETRNKQTNNTYVRTSSLYLEYRSEQKTGRRQKKNGIKIKRNIETQDNKKRLPDLTSQLHASMMAGDARYAKTVPIFEKGGGFVAAVEVACFRTENRG